MSAEESKETVAAQGGGSAASNSWTPARAAVLFAVVAVAWLVIDRATKLYFNQFVLGQDIGGPYAGLFEFTLVHNTGGAWGLFSNSTLVLGIFSAIISIVIGVLVIAYARRCSWVLTLGGALVFAGGIGNAIDRFIQGYVVDFIHLAFMDFPVFNIADIGVTCGLVLIVVAVLLFWKDESAPSSQEPSSDTGAKGGSR